MNSKKGPFPTDWFPGWQLSPRCDVFCHAYAGCDSCRLPVRGHVSVGSLLFVPESHLLGLAWSESSLVGLRPALSVDGRDD